MSEMFQCMISKVQWFDNILLPNGAVSAMKEGQWQPSNMFKKDILTYKSYCKALTKYIYMFQVTIENPIVSGDLVPVTV